MLNFKKVTHIIIVGIISVGYSCFVIQLAQSDTQTCLFLLIYCILLFLYSLKAYTAFHFPPTEPNIHTTNFDLNLIFTFKLTQERRRQLELALRDDRGTQRQKLERQYISQHKKPSFCDLCERVQPPRAYHCLFCDACIMGKQKHSKIIGFCIGQNNQIAYLIYLMVSKIISLYTFITLIYMQFNSNKFEKLSSFFQWSFVALICSLAALFIFYLKEFFLLFGSVQANKTICESKDRFLSNSSIDEENLSFNKSYQPITYLKILKQVVSLSEVGESSTWMSEIEDAHIQI